MSCYLPLNGYCKALTGAVLSVELQDGRAELMGDGMVVVLQRDPAAQRRPLQNVVLSRFDLEAMQVPNAPLSISLEDGEAHYMGDGLYIVMQRDWTARGKPMQNVVIGANDAAAILAAAA